jgi:hypothetical protein
MEAVLASETFVNLYQTRWRYLAEDSTLRRKFISILYRIGGAILRIVVLTSITVLKLREEHRLRVFENRVLRRTFGRKRDEVTGGWRKLHNEELHNLYSSPSIIRVIKSRKKR